MSENKTDTASFSLEAVSLSKQYGNRLALNQVSFTLFPGECLGIAGHNGSGKSTLLGLISQTLTADGGDLLYGGRSVMGDGAFLRTHMGYVPQQDGLLEDLKVEALLRYWQSLYESRDDSAYRFAVELMGLSPFLKKQAGELSGGMKKRVSIALALLGRPKILVMDEVFSALDQSYCDALLEYLKGFVSEGGSLLYCSHQKEELQQLCDRVLILKNGSVVFYDDLTALPSESKAVQGLFQAEAP